MNIGFWSTVAIAPDARDGDVNRAIERAVAEPRTDRRERGDQRPLHDRRYERELSLVAVLLRHHGELQRVREAAPAELAVPRETEELLETFLGPQSGAELDDRVLDELLVGGTPAAVGHELGTRFRRVSPQSIGIAVLAEDPLAVLEPAAEALAIAVRELG